MDPDLVTEPVPGTPGIREVRPDIGLGRFGICDQQNVANQGSRTVGLRGEIDTSAPFESVKEAVTRFGGSGSWMPYYKVFEEIDIKKVEEQAAELEKDLIVKELEALDVLEELGTTKRIVEELKLQLQKEALRCMAIPDENTSSPAIIKEMNKENYSIHVSNRVREQRIGSLSPCPSSSPDMILMELKQAKLNLGKTINDLGVIQTSVESLNRKMRKEKTFLQKMRVRLTSKFAGVLSLEEELKQARVKQHISENAVTDYKAEQLKKMAAAEKAEVSKAMLANEQTKSNIKTAELRLLAAKKMEEAARAAEAVAIAEIKALSGNETLSGFVLPEPDKVASFDARTPLTPTAQKAEGIAKKVEAARLQKREDITKMSILGKLREAAEEVKQSKQALEEALNKIEMANRKQSAAEEAIRKWIPENNQDEQAAYYATRFSNFHLHQSNNGQDSPFRFNEMKESNLVSDDPKPVLRSTVSMRDVLSKKQVLSEEYATERPAEVRVERQKVALSQMLHELREDLTFHPRAEKDGSGDQKQWFAHRRKFGFIHISLPMTKPSKKKMQDFNNVMH
ncbi:WEB family protein At2g40480 isoform X1 [Mercurialis annua]|uniref:WEB family protein At2g40480 isoform X1 n=1 Tax=Mercurialis annua TaxID=3986 RepID=UPI0021600C92|nr:WEB family protein At2g40480 isoform X1 [Mercurialis annua]